VKSPSQPAKLSRSGANQKLSQKTETGGCETTTDSVFSADCRRGLTPVSVTICLKPQMKKYRSLWYKSTTNHNILYFGNIHRISSLNTRNCLWKAQNTLAQRGFSLPPMRRARCQPRSFPPLAVSIRSLVLTPIAHNTRNLCISRPACASCGESGSYPLPIRCASRPQCSC